MKIRGNSFTQTQQLLPDQRRGDSPRDPNDHHGQEARWKHSCLQTPKKEKLEPSGFQGVFISSTEPGKFQHKTREALRKLDSKPAGACLLQQLAALNEMNPKKMVIIKQPQPRELGSAAIVAWKKPKWPLAALNCLTTLRAKRTKDDFVPYVAGEGADLSLVEFDPSEGMKFEKGKDECTIDPSLGFITLGHELIHSVHQLHGAAYSNPNYGDPFRDADSGAAEEELRTSGVGPWRDEFPSDNAIRREHGVQERPSYAGNKGENMRPPPETNSAHTEQRLRQLGAVHGRPLGRPRKED